MSTPVPSKATLAIRATVLEVLHAYPTSTTEVIDAVMARINAGLVRGCNIADRHDVRTAMEGLAALGKIHRHETGEKVPSRGRFRGGFKRAVRGSVSWSLPGNAATAALVWPA
jgi:hypothetical protein